MLTVICFSFLESRFVCIELDFNVEFDGNSERGGYYEQDNFIYNDDKSGFIGHTDGKFANSFIIWGHSTITWTKLYPTLTPYPSSGKLRTLYMTPPPSSYPRSY